MKTLGAAFSAIILMGSVQAAEIRLPSKLTCTSLSDRGKASREIDVLYTRINHFTRSEQLPGPGGAVRVWGDEKPKADEIASGWIGDGYEATLDSVSYNYILATCDSEDRVYSFRTSDLILAAGSSEAPAVKQVSGTLNVSIRNYSASFALACDAYYP